MNKICSIDANILVERVIPITQTLFFEKKDFKSSLNKEIIKTTISFLIEAKRSNGPLFENLATHL